MTAALKICGMRHPVNIAEVASLQPDYLGFIFYDQSPRWVGAHFRMPVIPSAIKRVGVFVNENTETILNTVHRHALDVVQLHGHETPEQCRELKSHGVRIIKAFAVDDAFDFETVRSFSDYVNYFLFDAKGKHFGGNGTAFNWSVLHRYDQRVPFFLSGGISAKNISRIPDMSRMNLHSFDVNSGVEISPGVKDVNRIKDLKQIINVL
ncbi:MAG TPA: phosphoribosylanthranilate isomerase [Cyclobacteriaceae bacterium]|nr:phosphoribosylanthranilate isomerase [Cyclobacteriaceae bacterium]